MLKIIIVMCIILNTIDGNNKFKIPGDFTIGALFRIHRASDPHDASMKCEKVREIHGLQRLEAALLALDMINNDTKILPGVTLGIDVRDICSFENSALRETLSLVKDIPLKSMLNPDNSRKYDYHDGKSVRASTRVEVSKLIGVIGPDTSERSLQVQSLLRLFHIPQIGYIDQSPELNDNNKYWTFLRIIPSDIFQTYVIRDILKNFHWTYVAIIATNEIFQGRLVKSFRKLVEPECSGSGICIAKNLRIKPLCHESMIDATILEIDEDKFVNVVICFCNRNMLSRLFNATKRLNLTNRFIFIASDRWANFDELTDGVKEQAWGSIFVNIHAPSTPIFSKYFTSLKPSKNTRNPWFKTFWEQKFDCILPMESADIKKVNSDENIQETNTSASIKFCTGNENLAQGYHEYRKTDFVMKAIWAMAHGLHIMMTEICGLNYTGVCPKMYPVNTAIFVKHLRKLSFYYEDELVTINDECEVLRYDILNFQKLPNNTFASVHIGDWRNGTLTFHKDLQSGGYKNVTSICSLPCPVGYQKIFTRDNKNQECCWICGPCRQYEYVSLNKEQCIKCDQDERPNANRTGCEKIPIDEHFWRYPMNYLILCFSIIGLAATVFTFYIFLKYKDTPVVKASSRELCYVILVGMILSHATVFFLLTPRNSFHCALSRTLAGISITMIFAGLFTKTHRIATILVPSKGRFPRKKHRFMSISAQIAITFFCVAIEITICSVMLLIHPPEPTLAFLAREHLILTCLTNTTNLIPSAVLVLILQVLCISYTIKTRNVPGNFNEAKFVGLAMLTSAVIYIIAITLFREIPYRSQVLTIYLTLNASAVLVFVFFPKLHIIIYEPERNNRSLFITNKRIRTHIGPRVNANIAESWNNNSTNRSTSNFRGPEGSRRLRRAVAVQTNPKFLLDVDDDKPSSDDDTNSIHDNGLALSKPNGDSDATVNNNHERMSFSRNNILRSRRKGSSMMVVESLNDGLNPLHHKHASNANNLSSTTPESCVELNVNNLL